jgi:hypothetical protein
MTSKRSIAAIVALATTLTLASAGAAPAGTKSRLTESIWSASTANR